MSAHAILKQGPDSPYSFELMIRAQGMPCQLFLTLLVSDLHGPTSRGAEAAFHTREGAFFIDNLLARIHFIIVMIRWTGLASWEFEFPFPGSLTSTFLVPYHCTNGTRQLSPHNETTESTSRPYPWTVAHPQMQRCSTGLPCS